METRVVDLVVIGAGAVGENVADRAAQGGLSVAMVESELVGGECSYWACMPSKALLRAGAATRAARAVEGVAPLGDVDPSGAFARRDRIVHDWDDAGQVEWATGAGIEVIRGHARLDGERHVVVTGPDGTLSRFEARHAVAVATGSAALLPEIPGLAGIEPWTSREATSATAVPASLAIIGGGVVGAEIATAYADLGSHVTLLARSGLLSGFEDFAGELVGDALRSRGVDVRTGTAVAEARKERAVKVLRLSDGSELRTSEVLVAIGRTARTSDLGLDTVGLEPGTWLEVDDTLRVRGFDWLYAVGDVNHRALLTHQGKYQARAAGDVIAARALASPVDDGPWGRHAATADHAAVPQVVFTDPEVASVGLTASRARAEGYRVRVLDYDLSWLAGATVLADGYTGRARAVVDEERGVLRGMTLVGPGVGELIHAATIAIVGEVPLERLWHAVPAYPTLSEVWLRLLEASGR